MKFFEVICLLSYFGSVCCFNGLSTLYNTHEEPPIGLDDYKSTITFSVKEKWIEQKLDHFDEKRTDVWSMRYLENDRFFKPGEMANTFLSSQNSHHQF